MKKEFGQNLQALMKEHRLSGRALAKEIGVSYKTLNEWCGPGGRMPRAPATLKLLADYFKVSIHYLLFGKEDERSLIGEILDKTELHTGMYEITVRKVKTRPIGDK